MRDTEPSAGFLAGFPDPAWSTDRTGVVLSWNPAAEHVFAVPAAQAVGRPATALVGHVAPAPAGVPVPVRLAPPGREPLRGTLASWPQDGPDGTADVVHHTLRVSRGATGVVSRQPLEALLEHVSDSIVTVDAEGTVLSLNQGAERMWDVRAADVVGRPVGGLIRHEPRPTRDPSSMAGPLRAGLSWHGVELECTTHTGRRLVVDTSATPLVDGDGAHTGAVLVSRDVTPVRELEASLRVASRALQQRASQLVQASHRDVLTGVAGRSLLQERLAAELSSAVESGDPVTVLAADLDGFRAINDSYGLAAGDAVLIAFAAHLRSQLPPSATAGRLGADEFAVVLPATTAQEAGEIADRIAAWTPPSPLPSRGRRPEDGPVGVTLGIVQATVAECRSSFDTGVRSVLLRAEGVVSQTKAARRARPAAGPGLAPTRPARALPRAR